MKRSLLGIGILLFAILLALSSSGMEIINLSIGLVGLVMVATGNYNEIR